MRQMYDSGMTGEEIGARMGIHPANVLTALRKSGAKMRRRVDYGGLHGAENPSWKGGQHISNGYVMVSVGKKRYRHEHRIVMEQFLGRSLKRDEIVHHMNGIRDDNRPENLAVTTLKDHEHHTYVKCLQGRIRELEHQLGLRQSS
jgi:hypothetical protein